MGNGLNFLPWGPPTLNNGVHVSNTEEHMVMGKPLSWGPRPSKTQEPGSLGEEMAHNEVNKQFPEL